MFDELYRIGIRLRDGRSGFPARRWCFTKISFPNDVFEITLEYRRKVKACYSNKSGSNVCHGASLSWAKCQPVPILETLELCDLPLDTACTVYEIVYCKTWSHLRLFVAALFLRDATHKVVSLVYIKRRYRYVSTVLYINNNRVR